MRHIQTTVLSALALAGVGAARANAAAYTFTTINAPGATTFAFGINNAGQVTGYSSDAAGNHGFVDTGGVFTSFNVPGAISTQGLGINASGQVAGAYQNTVNGSPHGFVYTNGTFALVDAPGATTARLPSASTTRAK